MNNLPCQISWLIVPPYNSGVNLVRRQTNFRKNKKGRAFLPAPCFTSIYPVLSRVIPWIFELLPTATAADHLEVGYRQVAVFIGVVLGFLFGLFLGVVHFLVVHGARHAYGVAHMVCQAAILALQFPRRTVIGHELVVVSLFLQAARHFANLAAIVVTIPILRVRETRGGQQRQPRKCEKAQC